MATEAETKAAADKAAKRKREENLEAAQTEENARNLAAASGPRPEPVLPMAAIAKSAVPRNRHIETTAYNRHAIHCEGLTLAEFMALCINDGAQKRYLYSLLKYFKRYDVVVCRGDGFLWEVEARIMKMDTELQTIQLSLMRPPVEHDLTASAKVNLDDVKVIDLGMGLGWSVVHGRTRLKTGMESEAEANAWLGRFKASAVADGKAA